VRWVINFDYVLTKLTNGKWLDLCVHDLYCVKKLREEFSDTIRCKQEKDAKKTAKHGR
jgi:hypothetical protein